MPILAEKLTGVQVRAARRGPQPRIAEEVAAVAAEELFHVEVAVPERHAHRPPPAEVLHHQREAPLLAVGQDQFLLEGLGPAGQPAAEQLAIAVVERDRFQSGLRGDPQPQAVLPLIGPPPQTVGPDQPVGALPDEDLRAVGDVLRATAAEGICPLVPAAAEILQPAVGDHPPACGGPAGELLGAADELQGQGRLAAAQALEIEKIVHRASIGRPSSKLTIGNEL